MRRLLETALLQLFRGLVRVVPYHRARWLPRLLLAWAKPVLAKPVARARARVAAVYPEWSPEECSRLVAESLHSLACAGVEWLYLDRHGEAFLEMVEMAAEGTEHLAALDQGGIMVGAHLGNWEIGGALMGRRLAGRRLVVVGRRQGNSVLDALSVRLRRRLGMEHATRHWRDAPALSQALAEGGVLGLVADQHASKGVPVTFLGLPALAFAGPALLARRHNLPIVATAVLREGWGRFREVVAPPIEVAEKTDAEVVQAYSDALGELVRRAPGQWMWLHGRWKGPKRG